MRRSTACWPPACGHNCERSEPASKSSLKPNFRGCLYEKQDAFLIRRASPHGHVAAVLSTLKKLGLDRLLTRGPQRRRKLVLKKRSRSQVLKFTANLSCCVVGMEACYSVHYLSRLLAEQGHEERQIAAQYARPFVKSNR